jgi:hypothetical protein
MLNKLQILICLFLSVSCKQICYDDLGCFESSLFIGGSFEKPIAFLPESPEKVNVSFTVYNRLNLNGKSINSKIVESNPTDLIVKAPIKFIVHGLFGNALNNWVIEMKDALLNIENLNGIIIK